MKTTLREILEIDRAIQNGGHALPELVRADDSGDQTRHVAENCLLREYPAFPRTWQSASG